MDNIPQHDAQTALNEIVLMYIKEQRSKRRFRWFRRIVYLAIVSLIIFALSGIFDEDDFDGQSSAKNKPHVALIDVKGEIFDDKSAGADPFVKSLFAAYKHEKLLKGVLIRINSPGGSPVQADYMFSAVRYFKEQHPNIPIYAVCVDLCASAAYYVAASTDKIYANPSSMVGSIGVIYNGFGFVDTMNKLGVTRRMQTAGINKGMLDPFSPVTDEQKAYLQQMLDSVHQQFIDRVKEGRGSRLHTDNPDLFTGLFWTGMDAKKLGLIDEFGSAGQIVRDVFKEDNVIDYTYQPSFYEKVAKNMGASVEGILPHLMGNTPLR
jgi:protease-4